MSVKSDRPRVQDRDALDQVPHRHPAVGYYGGNGPQIVLGHEADRDAAADPARVQNRVLDGRDRLRQLGRLGLVDRPDHRHLRRVHRPSRPRRRQDRAETARSCSSSVTTRATPTSSSQTSDATWEAYNDYGGNSLYTCTVACPAGNPLAYKAAYAVSYNRPFDGALNTDGGASDFYYAEYQMMRWMEENGYDVGYTSDSTASKRWLADRNHKVFISSGHDEYWSEGEYAERQGGAGAGVNVAYFSGNEMFWKTRWAASSDGTNTPYRTLISYKETHFNAPDGPDDPTTWTERGRSTVQPTGGRRDTRERLTGQEFVVDPGTADITVPSQYHAPPHLAQHGVAKLNRVRR